jgi:hypothetical protein
MYRALYIPHGLLHYPVQRIYVYSPVHLSKYSDHRRFGLVNTFHREEEGVSCRKWKVSSLFIPIFRGTSSLSIVYFIMSYTVALGENIIFPLLYYTAVDIINNLKLVLFRSPLRMCENCSVSFLAISVRVAVKLLNPRQQERPICKGPDMLQQ